MACYAKYLPEQIEHEAEGGHREVLLKDDNGGHIGQEEHLEFDTFDTAPKGIATRGHALDGTQANLILLHCSGPVRDAI